MDILYSLFSWRNLWTSCGVIGLLVMIWFSGPLIVISGYKPLEPIWVRVLLTILIILCVLGVRIYEWYKNRRLNKNVLEEIKANELSEEGDVVSDNALSEKFTKIDTMLQRHSSKKGNFLTRWFIDQRDYIYEKPWFLVIGAPGVGKTSSILNARLNFPIEMMEMDHSAKLVGTYDCDWFLTDHALFLDTAGRFVEQENGQKNTNEWQDFLQLLKRCRTKQPINGLVLMLSVDDVLHANDDKIKKQIQEMRLRLHELQKTFKTSFPIYLIVNKMDLISGFQQYFEYLDDEERDKALGIPLDISSRMNAENINMILAKLDKMVLDFQSNLFTSVSSNNRNNEPCDLAIGYPLECGYFISKLKIYLKRLLSLSQYDLDLKLAGVYFSSIKPQPSKMSISEKIDSLQLSEKYNDSHRSYSPDKVYFIHDIFNILLLNTANLASIDKGWLRRGKIFYWVIITGMTLLSLVLFFLIFRAYNSNYKKINVISNKLEKIEKYQKTVNSQQLQQMLELTDQVSNLSKQAYSFEKDSRWIDFGLNKSGKLRVTSEKKYNELIDGYIVPLISGKIDEQLKNSIDSKDYHVIYKNLKAYLMMYDRKHYDEKYFLKWIEEDFIPRSNIIGEQSESKADLLKRILTDKRIVAENSYNNLLVSQARSILRENDFAKMIYQELIETTRNMEQQGMPVVSFVTMGGPSTNNLFRRKGNKTLSDPVNILYTKFGYKKIFVPNVTSILHRIYHDELWVFGGEVSNKSEKQTLSEIYQMYSTDYIQTWQMYINDIQMLQPEDLQQAITMAKQLSDRNSALAGIIRGISENTSFAAEEQAIANAKNNTTNQVDEQYSIQGYLQEISAHFFQLNSLTQAAANNVSQLDEIVASINNLYTYLISLQMSMQSEDQLLPDTKPLVNYRAQISRLPDPFRPMLDVFAKKIGDTNKSYHDTQIKDLVLKYDDSLRQDCNKMTKNVYPFDPNSEQDASLQVLEKLFGKEGSYVQASNLEVSVRENLKLPFRPILSEIDPKRDDAYTKAASIYQKYFFNREQSNFNFTVKVLNMDKSIDNLNLKYGDKNINYYHGLQKKFDLSWPTKNNVIVLEASFDDGKMDKISVSGDWNLFRFLDKAEKIITTPNGHGVIATYVLNKQKVFIEFESTSNKVFSLSDFRNFTC